MRKWMIILSSSVTPQDTQDTVAVRDIEMLKSEETSIGLVCTIHTDKREVWSVRIKNGKPKLTRVK